MFIVLNCMCLCGATCTWAVPAEAKAAYPLELELRLPGSCPVGTKLRSSAAKALS